MQCKSLMLGALAVAVQAAPRPGGLAARASQPTYDSNDTSPACLPQNDPDQGARNASVAARAVGFVYGPSLIGEASPFPNGTMGNARQASDMLMWEADMSIVNASAASDAGLCAQAVQQHGGLATLDDYATVLYDGQWKVANPLGTAPGIMTNYTQDLLFSMERLSQNSFPLQLVKPSDPLPFQLADNITTQVTNGSTLAQLQSAGSLFVVDHSFQTKYPQTTTGTQRFGAACTGLFYIHPTSGDFLPLAIKTNVGSDLTYTPLDSAEDWLLAKMMFNVNDMFHAQMLHLVATHDVSEGVHQAALHTLSENHPVMIALERLMTEAYSSRIVGADFCFNNGGTWDQNMLISGAGCSQYVTDTWPTTGAFESNYIQTDLQRRGLVDSNGTYPFKSFPFFDDASVINGAFSTFFTSFVDSYYPADSDVAADYELQAWFNEAVGNKQAGVIDFPAAASKQNVVDVLTHVGFIVSVVHHSLNGGDPVGSKGTLPFHLPALYADVPAAKGVSDLIPFLPPAQNAIQYIAFLSLFNRPFYQQEHLTLENAFSNGTFDARLNDGSNAAAQTFMGSMQQLSSTIRSRTFDTDGLSMNMPFVYRTLDPGYIPFFCAI